MRIPSYKTEPDNAAVPLGVILSNPSSVAMAKEEATTPASPGMHTHSWIPRFGWSGGPASTRAAAGGDAGPPSNQDRRKFRGIALTTPGSIAAALVTLLALNVFALPAFAENSEAAPLAAKSLLLGIARAGDRLVAVGDRGHVLLSDDNGLTWQQRLVPTRAMLTGVSFPDERHGWAVGHDGVILATGDAGLTWTRQDDGKDLETIYLDVLFLDAQRGFAVGAYGKFLATSDGGRSWTPARPGADEVHYNCIAAGPNGWLYLAGESGTLLASRDGGHEWIRAEVPYAGSLFGVLPLGNQALVAFGLRGHILTSVDNGANWAQQNSDRPALIMGGTKLESGTIVLAGQGGNFFISRDAGASFLAWKPADFGTSVAGLVGTADGTVVTVGEAGAVRVKLP